MKPAPWSIRQKPMSAPKARKNSLAERLRENHDELIALNDSPDFLDDQKHKQMGDLIFAALQRSTIESLPAVLCPLLP